MPFSSRTHQKLLLCMTVLLLLSAVRFVHLQADTNFPTALGMLYTDEGWWTRNAAAWVASGDWYIDDGYNTITNLPVLSLIQVVWFKLFGITLTAARSLSVVCSLLVSGLIYLIARREVSAGLAWIAPFIFLSNYSTFAYSRLAILEMPMILLILVSLYLAIGLQKQTLLGVVGSGFWFAIAILTKTSALFALPVIAISVYFQPISLELGQKLGQKNRQAGRHIHPGIRAILIWLLTVGITFGICYLLLMYWGDHDSQQFFSDYNIAGKTHKSISSAGKGPFRVIERSVRMFPLLFPGLLGAIALLVKVKTHYTSPLFRIIVLWTGAVLSAFSLSSFAALRYFLVLIVPIALVAPLAIKHIALSDRSRQKRLSTAAALVLLLFVASTGYSLFQLGAYLRSPQFTLVDTARMIEQYVESDEPTRSNVVMGHFADTIALAAENVAAVNDQAGFRSLQYRIETFNPSYYVSVGTVEPEIREQLEEYYRLKLLEKFNVYQNRNAEEAPVFFYRLDPVS